MDLALKSTKWESVRERIRIAIEEEQKGKAAVLIQGADDAVIAGLGQVEEVGGNVLVTVNAGDSGLGDKGGAK